MSPEKNTIPVLKNWLNQNGIEFDKRQRKQYYVDLVNKNSDRDTDVESDYNNSNISYNNGKSERNDVRKSLTPQLPSNIDLSPITPIKDDKQESGLPTPLVSNEGVKPLSRTQLKNIKNEVRSILDDSFADAMAYTLKRNKHTRKYNSSQKKKTPDINDSNYSVSESPFYQKKLDFKSRNTTMNNPNNITKIPETQPNSNNKLFTLTLILLVGVVIAFAVNQWDQLYGNDGHEILYCDTDAYIVLAPGFVDDDGRPLPCFECPTLGICKNGKVNCQKNHVLRDNNCVLNSEVVAMAYEIEKQIIYLLSIIKGDYDCGYTNTFKISEDYIRSNIKTSNMNLINESFEYFKQNILSLDQSAIKYMPKNSIYYVDIGIKSYQCEFKSFILDNWIYIGISIFIIVILIFIYYKRSYKAWELNEVNILMTEVYDLLDEAKQYNDTNFIPIDQVKQQLNPKTHNIWYLLNKKLLSDGNIQKSMRMINGLQKECIGLLHVNIKRNFKNKNTILY